MSVSQGSRVSGVATDSANREKDDFYPTPPYATEALLAREEFHGLIWEPACGDGAISEVLKAHGKTVRSTDLVDRGYGDARVDFLMEYKNDGAYCIITKPPFKYATEFAWKACSLVLGKVAFLVRLQFLESISRKKLFEAHPPKKIWVFSERLTMQRGRQTTDADTKGMNCFVWIVWEYGYDGPTELGWI